VWQSKLAGGNEEWINLACQRNKPGYLNEAFLNRKKSRKALGAKRLNSCADEVNV